MIRAGLSLIRLVAVLTAISMAAVGISVALSGFLRAQSATSLHLSRASAPSNDPPSRPPSGACRWSMSTPCGRPILTLEDGAPAGTCG